MRNSVIAIVLCFFAVAASARCEVAQVPGAGIKPVPGMMNTSNARDATQQELPMDDEPPVVSQAPQDKRGRGREPGSAGTGMVLAAVAVMSAIALRRNGRFQ